MIGGKRSYLLTGIPRIRQVQSPCIITVTAIGLVSEVGQPPSCQLYALVGTRGPGAMVKGAIKAASELGEVLPELPEGNPSISSTPASKGGLLYSPRGHWMGPLLLLQLLGETSW